MNDQRRNQCVCNRVTDVLECIGLGGSSSDRNLVEQVSPSSRLELFARNACEGWTCWGNEIKGFVSHGIELEKLDKAA